MTTIAEKKSTTAEQAEDTAPRVAPQIHVNCVQRNKAGAVWCQWSVRFPEGGIADDLKEPGIWKRIQDNPNTALKRFDEVRILAHDASWMAHAVVAHATGNAVILAKPVITKLPEQQENLYQDERFYVKFVGNGYGVFRKTDDLKMVSDAWPSAALAETALRNLYPTKVA